MLAQNAHDRLLSARLPVIPQVLLKLLTMCRADNLEASELAQVVGKDAGMTGRVLGLASSCGYQAEEGRIGLEQALAALGRETFKTLVFNESASQVFGFFKKGRTIDLRDFWLHSLNAAILAQELAKRLSCAHEEEAYLVGLLHNIGRLALLSAVPEHYAPHFRAGDGEHLCEIEKAIFQATHAEVGGWIVERWRLDSFLADSVFYHHEPAEHLQAVHPLARIALLVNRLATDGPESPAVGEACALFRLDPHELATLHAKAGLLSRQAADQLGIVLAPSGAPPTSAASGDAECYAQLAEEVQHIMMASAAAQLLQRQRSDVQLIEALVRSVRLLFGAEDALLLKMGDDNQSLTGVPSRRPRRQRLAEYSLSLAAESRISKAVVTRSPTFIHRKAAPISVEEDQILRLLGADAAVCIPLATSLRTAGVLVCAVQPWRMDELRGHFGCLKAFAAQGGSAVVATLQDCAEISDRIDAIREDYESAARRIVHEVNNPLSIIRNYLCVLDAKLSRQEPVGGEISILNEEIERVGQIVRSFVQIKPESAAGMIDVNRAVRDAVRLFQEAGFASPSLRVIAQIQNEPLTVAGEPNLLRQMLVNLIKNAVEAMPQGGEVRVAANGLVNRSGRLYVEMTVKDTGPGIGREAMANLFGQAKSSKGGGHQGLGLRIVNELANRLEGEVSCGSSKEGTTFSILLPAVFPAPVGEHPAPT